MKLLAQFQTAHVWPGLGSIINTGSCLYRPGLVCPLQEALLCLPQSPVPDKLNLPYLLLDPVAGKHASFASLVCSVVQICLIACL